MENIIWYNLSNTDLNIATDGNGFDLCEPGKLLQPSLQYPNWHSRHWRVAMDSHAGMAYDIRLMQEFQNFIYGHFKTISLRFTTHSTISWLY